MGRSQETYNKKEVRKNKEKKRKEKAEKKLARKEEGKKSFDDMIAYVDEFGNIVDTPPDPTQREEIDAEDIVLGIPPKEEEPEEEKVKTGKVSFFNYDKGYGFIKDSNGKDSIFVHINNAYEDIQENDKVSYEIEMGPKGPTAVRVQQQ